MARDRKKELKHRYILIAVWVVFLAVLGGFGYFAFKKKAVVEEDLGITSRFSYQTNANPDINALITIYLHALSACDQETLKSCVTDPSQFDNMTPYQSQSMIITAYNNINCYTVKGLDDDSTIVYAVTNISIVNVESTPLDIMRFYVVKKDGQYLIDNSILSDKVQKYMDKANKDKDIQELYELVDKDEKEKAEQDPALKEFLDRLYN